VQNVCGSYTNKLDFLCLCFTVLRFSDYCTVYFMCFFRQILCTYCARCVISWCGEIVVKNSTHQREKVPSHRRSDKQKMRLAWWSSNLRKMLECAVERWVFNCQARMHVNEMSEVASLQSQSWEAAADCAASECVSPGAIICEASAKNETLFSLLVTHTQNVVRAPTHERTNATTAAREAHCRRPQATRKIALRFRFRNNLYSVKSSTYYQFLK
jgi:hypothetical protein